MDVCIRIKLKTEIIIIQGKVGHYVKRECNSNQCLLMIYSDGWADRADVVAGYERQALGSITVKIHSPYIDSFDKRYFGLSPFTNVRNPWFNEFWEHKFACQLPSEPNALQPLTNFFDKRVCTGMVNYMLYRLFSSSSIYRKQRQFLITKYFSKTLRADFDQKIIL